MARKRAAESDAEEADTLPKRVRVETQHETNTMARLANEDLGNNARETTPIVDFPDDCSVVELPGPPEEKIPAPLVITPDAEFERLYAERVKEYIQRVVTCPGAAEAGIISRIEAFNFMCHKHLSFPLGPQINFIVGRNGSGKSAALSAITVALGGKASSTGRGSGLKSFIKSGESAAEVSITLTNGGHEPFRPLDYGNEITITRQFTESGSSSYKIKSKTKRVISTSRVDLNAVLDHFSIDVDNPMNILTQDLARQFLSASNKTAKYKLFMKGTLLRQLKEEYGQILDNTNKTSAMAAQKNKVVKELQAAYVETEARYEKAKNLQEAAEKLDVLKAELAWAHIKEKEADLSKSVVETENAKGRRKQIEDKVEEAQRTLQECENNIDELEVNHSQAAGPEELNQQLQDLNKKISDGKKVLHDAKRDLRDIAEVIKKENRKLERMESEIAEGEATLARDGQREEVRANIQAAQHAHDEADANYKESVNKSDGKKQEQDACKRELDILEGQLSSMQTRDLDAEERLQQLRQHAHGKGGTAIYGQGIPGVRLIDSTRWVGIKPVGPLGMHVHLKDKKWAKLLRIRLGYLMGSFAVTNMQDCKTLRKILNENGGPRTSIIVAQPDIFDYSAGEPPTHLTTVLRVLEIDNEWVTRIMINHSKIERLLLADSRGHAERLLEHNSRFTVWTADCLRVQRFSDGGGVTASLGRTGGSHDFRNLLFADQSDEEILDAEHTLQDLRPQCEDLARQKQDLTMKASQADREFVNAKREERRNFDVAKATRKALTSARAEDVQERPIDLTILEDAADATRTRITELQGQLKAASESCKFMDSQNAPLVEQASALRRQIDGHKDRQQEIQIEIDEAVIARTHALAALQHYRDKLTNQETKVRRLTEKQALEEEEYTNWRVDVEDHYAEVKTSRTSKIIERELNTKKAAHQRSVEEQGHSIEDILHQLERASIVWHKAKKDVKDVVRLVQSLRRSYEDRIERWHAFRQFITLRIKLYFQYLLSLRGFHGQVLIHYAEDEHLGELDLRVQTDDHRDKTEPSHEQRAKISGGEKSFATICFLLSIWAAMGSPIRALDEFDVYMDAVNRHMSMKMMLDVAKNSAKHYILITPQDMSTVPLGPAVRVHLMKDPERGQQTLGFR